VKEMSFKSGVKDRGVMIDGEIEGGDCDEVICADTDGRAIGRQQMRSEFYM